MRSMRTTGTIIIGRSFKSYVVSFEFSERAGLVPALLFLGFLRKRLTQRIRRRRKENGDATRGGLEFQDAMILRTWGAACCALRRLGRVGLLVE